MISETTRLKMSESQKIRFENPAERKRQSNIHKKLYEDPDYRKRQSDTMKLKHATDEGYKLKHSDATKRMWGDPEYRKKQKETRDILHADPDYQMRQRESHQISQTNPDTRKRMSVSQRKRWEDPAHRKHMSDAHISAWEDPIIRAKTTLALKQRYDNPEFCKKMQLAMSERYEDPKLIEKISKEGFWYGHWWLRRTPYAIYCELWKDVNPRVHAWFNYRCCLCGAPENGKSHIGHHVFYVKEACCWSNDSGIYYTNLNAREHPAKDYCIGKNPNYFVILCQSCHGKTNGNFANRKKWADFFKDMIDTQYSGKCYFTKDEIEFISGENNV